MTKPIPLFLFLALTLVASANRPDAVVTFNEVHYNPADAATSTEWVELHNQMAVDIALDRWSLRGGIDYTFPDGTTIPGGGFLTIAQNPALLPGALGPFTGSLNNAGDSIDLINNSERLMDRLRYGDSGDWPVAPDGSGATLSKRNPNAASGPSRSWTTSLQIGGTPSNPNFPPPGLPVQHDLVSSSTSWRYDDSDSPPPADWTSATFDDTTWPGGEAPLGTADTAAPTSLTVTAGLVERFRASAITGVNNGATFATWPDTATADGTAQDATAGGNPTFQTDATPSGKPAVRFDGNDEFRTSASPGIGPTSGFTYFLVSKANDQPNSGALSDGNGAYLYDRDASTGNPLVSLKAVSGTYGLQKRNDDGSALGGPVATTPISTAEFQITAVRRNRTADRFELWVDGNLEGTETDPGANLTPQPIVIGRHASIATGGFDGDIAELLIYNSELSDSDFQTVGAYLESEYGLDTAFAGTSVKTQLAADASTAYLRNTFTFSGDPSRTTLQLQASVADAAAFYLNGTEIHRTNLPDGTLDHATFALTDQPEPLQTGTLSVPADALVNGQNTLAVRLHRSAPASDTFFAAALSATETPPDPDAPATLVLNEIPGANTADDAFYVEIKNIGNTPAPSAGYSIVLSSGGSYDLPPGSFNAGDSTAFGEADLGFRPRSGDRLFLVANGGTSVADARRVTNRLRGRSPDHPGRWLYPSAGSPGSENPFTFNSDIVINEIHYNPAPLQASPPSLQTDPLFSYGHVWRYNESGENLGAAWPATSHPVAGNWRSGPGVLAFESGLPLTVGTNLSFPNFNNPYVTTYYFETEFTLTETQAASAEALALSHLIDDGAVFYLNGVEIHRTGMPAGAVASDTLATPANSEASLIGPVSVPVGNAVAGTNRLSVEVHQESTDSPDIVFGLELGITYGAPARPFRKSDEQWVELFNRGSSTVDLSAWSFAEGLSYQFPQGTSLAPGGYLVVANDPPALAAKHPGITVLGPFSGKLARDGEDIRLRDAANNPADEVRYFDSGRWPDAADGGGSSLELRDPDADNNIAESWAASDESSRSTWQTYSYTGTAAASVHGAGADNQWREFVFGLLTAGEVLVDDLSVVEEGATQLIVDGDFESGESGFRLIGNHRHSEVGPDPTNPANHVLRLVATGPTEHMHNHVETNLGGPRRVTNGREYTISFRAKWVSGSPQLHTRLYFNRLPKTTIVATPARSGTPGAPNTAATTNAGPTYSNLNHSPAVPAPGAPVTVSVGAADPDGVAALTLHYSVDSGPFTQLPMAASGNTYSATIPGQSAASVVQFYIHAEDGLGATASFPAAGPDSRAAYKVDDGLAADTGVHNIRIVMTPDDRDFFYQVTNVMSNDIMPCTVIVDESEIYYGAGVRIKGSERTRTNPVRVSFSLRFGTDQLFRGVHRAVGIDRSEGTQTGVRESIFDLTMTNAGAVPAEYNDLVKVLAPRNDHTSFAALQLARYGSVFLDSQFDNGADGTVYELELIYYPTTAQGGYKVPQPDNVIYLEIRDLGDDQEDYRWMFNIKNNRERDDYTRIMAMAAHFSKRGAAFQEGLEDIIDVEQWLRALAFSCVTGAGDSYFSNSRHNGQFYTRPDGRVLYFPHDLDFSYSATRSITENQDLQDIIQNPAYRRSYYGHLYDICSRVFNRTYMQPWVAHYNTLVPRQNFDLGYIHQRSTYILSQVSRGIRPTDFAITTNGGNAFTTGTSPVTLEGTGWVDVRTVRLAGSAAPLAVTWTSTDEWTLDLPVAAGENTITLEAYDFQGDPVASDTITVTNTSPSLELASATNIAVSEIHYNPDRDTGSDETHEFIELTNISPDQTVDLTGSAFTDGITFTFPAGTTLAPGARLVLARDPATYPDSLGPYTGALNNTGETLTLTSLNGPVIRSFAYGDSAPWPPGPDGGGPSLVLVAPGSNPDHALAVNWRSSTANGGNPGTTDSVPFDPATGDLLTYALGAAPTLNYDLGGFLTFSQIPATDDAVITPQWSTDLKNWSTDSLVFRTHGAYIFTPPPIEIRTIHFRLHVQQRP